MEDEKILRLLFARSESAIDALMRKFGRQVTAIARNILGLEQDAQEAVNDTWLAVWDAIPPARPKPLGAFVCRIGRNISLNQLRSRTAQKRDSRYDLCMEELSQILPDTTTEELVDARALGRCINDYLGGLEAQARWLFLRRYWFGDSVKELSRQTGLSENVLSVRLHRLRKQLKEHLIKEEFWHEAQ